MTAHHNMGPSSASRWLACTASPKAIQDAGAGSSAGFAAAEGTVAHLVTEWLRTGEIRHAEEVVGETVAQDGFGIVIDEEMARHASGFCARWAQVPGEAYVEVEVDLDPWHPTGFGTSDHIIVNEEERILHVVDFKYGKGVKVFAEENPQMRLYALGAVNSVGWMHGLDWQKAPEGWEVRMTVDQPRLGHLDTWSEPLTSLLAWGAEYVRPRSVQAQAGEGEFAAGPHCRFCPLSGDCAEQSAHLRQSALADFDRLPPERVYEMTNAQIGALLDEMDDIKRWLASVEAQGKARAMDGNPPVGRDGPYKLVEGRKSRDWAEPDVAEQMLAGLLGDRAYEKKFVSPAKAQKLLPKAEWPGLSNQLVVTKPGAPTLAPATDERQPYTSAEADGFQYLES